MTLPTAFNSLSEEWQNASILCPLYSALHRELSIDLPGCPDVTAADDCPSKETVEQVRSWLCATDDRVPVHQLRHFLQTTTLSSEHTLQALLLHHLQKEEPSDSDRDKIDFLLVQYFSHCAPLPLEDTAIDIAYVAHALEPVLGTIDLDLPMELAPLDPLLQEVLQCSNLQSLLASHALDKGREIKRSMGKNYYLPVALVVCTRFGFIMRRMFFRLLHRDLNAILDGLRVLQERGVTTLDGRRAYLTDAESIDRLRQVCQSWKVMFFAEYSAGQPVSTLVELRTVVEEALRNNTGTEQEPKRERSFAAAAAGDSTAGVADPPANIDNDGSTL